jgi:hypothetical protein
MDSSIICKKSIGFLTYPPEVYFQNLEKDTCFAYYNRPCSVREYYEWACRDTPGYVKGHGNLNGNPYKAARHPAPIAHNPGFCLPQGPPPDFDEDEALARWRNNVAEKGKESSSATNDSTKFSASQKWAAEQTQAKRQKARADQDQPRVPIPTEEDSAEDTECEADVFDEHLLPHDKLRIDKLKEEHKRIRAGVFPRSYLNARDRDIKAAEQERLKGGAGLLYLAGYKTPWSTGMGQTPQRYDDYQKERIMLKIAKIKQQNAELCQTHYHKI